MSGKSDATATQKLVSKQDKSKSSFFDLPIEVRHQIYEHFCNACHQTYEHFCIACHRGYSDSASDNPIIIATLEKTAGRPLPSSSSWRASIAYREFKGYISTIAKLRLASSTLNLEFTPIWAATTSFAVESGEAGMLEPKRFVVFLGEMSELRSLATQVSEALSLLPKPVVQRMRRIGKSFVVSVAAHHAGLISETFDFLQCDEGKRLCQLFTRIPNLHPDFVIELCVTVRHGVERGPEVNRRAKAILTFQQLAVDDCFNGAGAWVCTSTLMNGVEHEHAECIPGEQCKRYRPSFYDPH